jgi:tryptophan synthase alpha chain
MNRITQLFSTQSRPILSIYFTAGYPRQNDTLPILQALQAKGVDMAEIGVPFSDPMADGPVIQQASTRALRNGMTLRLLFRQLDNIRPTIHIPLILMSYLNPIMQYGFDTLCRHCAERGVDGLIIPDLPFADYLNNYKATADRHNIHLIMLITPETTEDRIRQIDAHTRGFIYLVSGASITGAQQNFDAHKQAYFRRIRDMHLKNPCLTGFGVSNRATYQAAIDGTSGAIIGSRFIQLLADEPTPEQAIDHLLTDLGIHQSPQHP